MRRSVIIGCVATLVATMTAAVFLGGAASPSGAQPAAGPGEYVALTPSRILDTRDANGPAGLNRPVAARGTIDLPVSGAGGLPDASAMSAVVLNLTATGATARGYVTAYPSGAAQPTTSVLNFAAGEVRAHTVVVAPGADGSISLFNGAQSPVDLIADVVGYYAAGVATEAGQFALVPQARLLDTRTTLGGHHGQITVYRPFDLQVSGRGGVPATASAVLLNVTVTRSTNNGYVCVQCAGTSTVNVAKGQTASNLAIVPLSAAGTVDIEDLTGPYPSGGADVVVDVFGYYLGASPWSAGRLGPIRPTRLLDTRDPGETAIPAGGTRTLQVAGNIGVPADATAAALNLTVASPTGSGYLSAYPSGGTRPLASTLNFAGRTTANATLSTLGSDGAITIYNSSSQPQEVVVDVTGYVGAVPGPYHWGRETALGSGTAEMSGVSCTSASFCAAVGNTDYQTGPSRVWFWRGSAWSTPSTISTDTPVRDISCVSATFCVAIADSRSYTWNGTTWTAKSLPDPGGIPLDTRSISCVTTTFCLASGGRWDVPFTWRFDGSTWTESDPGIPHEDGRPVVSCASTTFCVAVGSEEGWDASTWNGTGWHPGPRAGNGFDVAGVSCPTGSTACTAVSADEVRSFDGTTWGADQDLPAGTHPTTVACLSAANCVATAGGNAVTFGNGSSWTSAAALDPSGIIGGDTPGARDVSCPSAGFCVVLESSGAIIGVTP